VWVYWAWVWRFEFRHSSNGDYAAGREDPGRPLGRDWWGRVQRSDDAYVGEVAEGDCRRRVRGTCLHLNVWCWVSALGFSA
jgi:hypothetical protein